MAFVRAFGVYLTGVVLAGTQGIGLAGDREEPAVVAVPGPPPLIRQAPVEPHHLDDAKVLSFAARIDACVEADMGTDATPGAAVAVSLDGEVLYEHGYGVKNVITRLPVLSDTVFRIGSITKQMVAGSVMQQVELGRVDLRDTVTKWIPELEIAGRWPAATMSVWHTLTHTTGFPDVIEHGFGSEESGLSDWAAAQGDMLLYAAPGSFWNYSNPNFMMAGLVAERASGVPYRRLIEGELWAPAGMLDTTFDARAVVQAGNYASGHVWMPDPGEWRTVSPYAVENHAAGPAGWALSTAPDLVRWANLLMDGGGAVLAEESTARMQRRQVWTNLSHDLHYGLGIMVESYKGLDVRQHGGNISGWGSYLLWIPERRLAIAILANGPRSLTPATYCVADVVLDLPAEWPAVDETTDVDDWQRFRGTYDLYQALDGERFEAEVFVDGGELLTTVTGATIPVPGGVTGELVQVYSETFVTDLDGDGNYDVDFTFITSPGEPGRVEFVRNRQVVGTKRLLGHDPPGRF